MMENIGLNIFTSRIAIGSLWIVSLFLILCGIYNIFPLIEWLSSTKTWEILVAIPLIIISYTIGAIVINLSNLIFDIIALLFKNENAPDEISNLIIIINKKNDLIASIYNKTKNDILFFQACIPTTLLLTISVFLSAYLLPNSESIIAKLIASSFLILFMPTLLIMIINLRKKIKRLIANISS